MSHTSGVVWPDKHDDEVSLTGLEGATGGHGSNSEGGHGPERGEHGPRRGRSHGGMNPYDHTSSQGDSRCFPHRPNMTDRPSRSPSPVNMIGQLVNTLRDAGLSTNP